MGFKIGFSETTWMIKEILDFFGVPLGSRNPSFRTNFANIFLARNPSNDEQHPKTPMTIILVVLLGVLISWLIIVPDYNWVSISSPTSSLNNKTVAFFCNSEKCIIPQTSLCLPLGSHICVHISISPSPIASSTFPMLSWESEGGYL